MVATVFLNFFPSYKRTGTRVHLFIQRALCFSLTYTETHTRHKHTHTHSQHGRTNTNDITDTDTMCRYRKEYVSNGFGLPSLNCAVCFIFVITSWLSSPLSLHFPFLFHVSVFHLFKNNDNTIQRALLLGLWSGHAETPLIGSENQRTSRTSRMLLSPQKIMQAQEKGQRVAFPLAEITAEPASYNKQTQPGERFAILKTFKLLCVFMPFTQMSMQQLSKECMCVYRWSHARSGSKLS